MPLPGEKQPKMGSRKCQRSRCVRQQGQLLLYRSTALLLCRAALPCVLLDFYLHRSVLPALLHGMPTTSSHGPVSKERLAQVLLSPLISLTWDSARISVRVSVKESTVRERDSQNSECGGCSGYTQMGHISWLYCFPIPTIQQINIHSDNNRLNVVYLY